MCLEEYKYEVFDAVADDVGRSMAAACLLVFYKRGRTKKYGKQFYQDLQSILKMPEIFGKVLTCEEVRKCVEEYFGLDLEEIVLNKETKAQYRRRKAGE